MLVAPMPAAMVVKPASLNGNCRSIGCPGLAEYETNVAHVLSKDGVEDSQRMLIGIIARVLINASYALSNLK